MNKIELVGRLVKDSETRFTKEGKGITTFTLAVNNSKDDTTFIKITTFGGTSDLVQKYCKKGDLILVDGMIKNNNYEDKDGNKHFEYIFIGNRIEFLSRMGNNTKKVESSLKPSKNELDDDEFRKFGEKIEIEDNELAF